jgi:hypothetical protein
VESVARRENFEAASGTATSVHSSVTLVTFENRGAASRLKLNRSARTTNWKARILHSRGCGKTQTGCVPLLMRELAPVTISGRWRVYRSFCCDLELDNAAMGETGEKMICPAGKRWNHYSDKLVYPTDPQQSVATDPTHGRLHRRVSCLPQVWQRCFAPCLVAASAPGPVNTSVSRGWIRLN